MSTTATKVTTTKILRGSEPSAALPVMSKDFNPVIDDVLDLDNRVAAIEGGTVTLVDIVVSSTVDATTKDTGSIITEGGIGVEKAIYTGTSITAGTNLIVVGATDATTPTTGSLKTAGGLGVAKAAYFGTSVNATTFVTSGDGTAALPAIGPVSDPDSGMYSVGANRLGLSVSAAKRLEVNTSGVGVVGYFVKGQIAPTNSDTDPADKTVMATSMLNGILTATPGGAIAYTLPTGTQMQTAAGTTIDVDQSIDFTLINIGAGGIITVTAAAAFTIVGVATVAAASSANFRIRKTAANTFVLYRMA